MEYFNRFNILNITDRPYWIDGMQYSPPNSSDICSEFSCNKCSEPCVCIDKKNGGKKWRKKMYIHKKFKNI